MANLALANLLIILCAPIRLAAFGLRHFVCFTTGGRCQSQQLAATADVLHRLDQLEDFLLIFASPLLWSSLLFFVA